MSATESQQASFSRLGAGIIHTFLVQVLSTTNAVVLILVTSRTLGPTGKGALTLALLGARVLDMTINFGLGHALMYFRAQARWAPGQLLGTAYALWGALSLALVPLALALPSLQRLLPDGLTVSAAWLVLSLVSARLLQYFLGWLLLGSDRLRAYTLLNLLCSSATAANCLLVVAFGQLTVEIVLVAYILGTLLACAGAAYHLGSDVSLPSPAVTGACFRYGAQIAVGQGALFLNNRLDTFLVGSMLTVADVGLYSAAVALGEIVWRLPNVVATVLYPMVASAPPGQAAAMTGRVCRITLLVVAAACAGIGILVTPLVQLLFGEEFVGAVLPTLFLLPGMVTLTLFTLLYHDLAGRGLPGPGLAAALAGLAVTLGLDLLLIPRLGIAGAALASSVAYSVSAAWVAVVFNRRSGSSMSDLLLPTGQDWQDIVRLCLRPRLRTVQKEG